MAFEEETDNIPSTRDQVFDFLVRYKLAHDGNSPSLREIADACNIVLSGAHYHLTRLQLDNRIRLGGKSRMIEVVGAEWHPPDHYVNQAAESRQDYTAREGQQRSADESSTRRG